MQLRDINLGQVVYPLPPNLEAFSVICALICTFAVLFNIFIFALFANEKKLWTVPNYLVINLAVTDFLLCTFNGVIYWANVAGKQWNVGNAGCQIQGFANILFCGGSLFGLAIVGYERFSVIVKHQPFSPKKAGVLVAGAWATIIGVCTFPFWFGNHYVLTNSAVYCGGDWSSHTPSGIAFTLICLCCVSCPLQLFAYTYWQILKEVKSNTERWNQRQIGSPDSKPSVQRNQSVMSNNGGGGGTQSANFAASGAPSIENSKQQRAQMLEAAIAKKAAILVGAFVCNWFPYDIQFIWELVAGKQANTILCSIATATYLFNSLCNPVLFIALDARWKSAAFKLLGIEELRTNSTSSDKTTSSDGSAPKANLGRKSSNVKQSAVDSTLSRGNGETAGSRL